MYDPKVFVSYRKLEEYLISNTLQSILFIKRLCLGRMEF